METNPYAAPSAVVADTQAFDGNTLEARKASRAQRFGAAFIDGIVIGVGTVPLSFYAMQHVQDRKIPFSISTPVLAVGIVVLLIVCIINYVLINRHGQTIGKLALGIKTVRQDGSPVTAPRVFFLRYLPITLAALIPAIGGLIGLVDACMIFGSEKRCLHDLIADTIVINA
jgi:uncharacterized RDD family membrane protein YckC